MGFTGQRHTAEARTAMSAARTRHGHAVSNKRSHEYHCWIMMKQRCENPKATAYPYYGGRGIHVCEAWRESFAVFLADVGAAPSPRHTLDRQNQNGHYEPGNIRWATKAEQTRNRRPFVFGRSLSPDDVRQIRQLAPTLGRREIALRFGISHHSVTDILLGRTWKAVA